MEEKALLVISIRLFQSEKLLIKYV